MKKNKRRSGKNESNALAIIIIAAVVLLCVYSLLTTMAEAGTSYYESCEKATGTRTLTGYRINWDATYRCRAERMRQQKEEEMRQAALDNIKADTELLEQLRKNLRRNR